MILFTLYFLPIIIINAIVLVAIFNKPFADKSRIIDVGDALFFALLGMIPLFNWYTTYCILDTVFGKTKLHK